MQTAGASDFPWPYSAAEQWADGVVHTLGVLLATIGAVVLLASVAGRVQPAEVASVGVYLATLLLSIAASAAYNLWPVSPTKWRLRRLDHSAIYLLIAGTYTPLMVETGMAWMLAFVWSIAAFGVVLKLGMPGRFDRLAVALYLALGWSGAVVYDDLVAALPEAVLWLIVAGGIVYSLGVIFHLWETLRFQNVIWHAFVLVAAAIHFMAVFVLTAGAS